MTAKETLQENAIEPLVVFFRKERISDAMRRIFLVALICISLMIALIFTEGILGPLGNIAEMIVFIFFVYFNFREIGVIYDSHDLQVRGFNPDNWDDWIG